MHYLSVVVTRMLDMLTVVMYGCVKLGNSPSRTESWCNSPSRTESWCNSPSRTVPGQNTEHTERNIKQNSPSATHRAEVSRGKTSCRTPSTTVMVELTEQNSVLILVQNTEQNRVPVQLTEQNSPGAKRRAEQSPGAKHRAEPTAAIHSLIRAAA